MIVKSTVIMTTYHFTFYTITCINTLQIPITYAYKKERRHGKTHWTTIRFTARPLSCCKPAARPDYPDPGGRGEYKNCKSARTSSLRDWNSSEKHNRRSLDLYTACFVYLDRHGIFLAGLWKYMFTLRKMTSP